MSSDSKRSEIRRILVALDASPHSEAALEAAAELAHRAGAELLGLYVEDINLLRLAQLPFAQEVGQFTAIRRQLDVREVERQIRGQTVRVRRMLEVTTRRTRLRWSFEVTRGTVVGEVLRAASDVDALVLGRSGWSLVAPGRMGSTARAVLAPEAASPMPGLCLIVPSGGCLGAPFMVIYDGSALAERALDIAAELMREDEQPLIVLLLAEHRERLEPLVAQVQAWLGERDLELRYVTLSAISVPDLVNTLHTERCGTLVLPSRSDVLDAEALQAVMDQVEVPILLVR
ncbi:MAG: universal stress protein [Anaerolineae bacterium]